MAISKYSKTVSKAGQEVAGHELQSWHTRFARTFFDRIQSKNIMTYAKFDSDEINESGAASWVIDSDLGAWSSNSSGHSRLRLYDCDCNLKFEFQTVY